MKQMRHEEDNVKALLREHLGKWMLVSGALSLWIGLLLLFLGPSPSPGDSNYLHKMAYEGMGTGIFLILIGILAQRIFRS